jgi:hypothetical protein
MPRRFDQYPDYRFDKTIETPVYNMLINALEEHFATTPRGRARIGKTFLSEQQVFDKYVEILKTTYPFCTSIKTRAMNPSGYVQEWSNSKGMNWLREFQLSEERCRYAGPVATVSNLKDARAAHQRYKIEQGKLHVQQRKAKKAEEKGKLS